MERSDKTEQAVMQAGADASASGISRQQALDLLAGAERLYSAAELDAAVRRVALDINADLGEHYPLVLSVMGGAVVFTGHLLPLLAFPLDFDILKVSRYGLNTGGGDITWSLRPRTSVRGRTVLVLDDILDEGETLAAIRTVLLDEGARSVHTAVMTDKEHGRAKPIVPDYVGITVPNRYVFGYGMDVHGLWRNLPDIFALRD
jgi:hypoxanthine phosphoribosyltransferase